MKFSEMPYERPDLEAFKGQMTGFTNRLKAAGSYDEAKAVFLEKEEADRHVETMATLAQVRNTIDTRDAFYDGEVSFWNAASPELEEYEQAWKLAMLESPFRKDFEGEYGGLMFLNTEIAHRLRPGALRGQDLYPVPDDPLPVRPGRRAPSGGVEGGGDLVQGAPGRPGPHL